MIVTKKNLLNGKTSEWAQVLSGVPQGSVIRISADDVSLFHIVDDPSASLDDLQHDLNKISVISGA